MRKMNTALQYWYIIRKEGGKEGKRKVKCQVVVLEPKVKVFAKTLSMF